MEEWEKYNLPEDAVRILAESPKGDSRQHNQRTNQSGLWWTGKESL